MNTEWDLLIRGRLGKQVSHGAAYWSIMGTGLFIGACAIGYLLISAKVGFCTLERRVAPSITLQCASRYACTMGAAGGTGQHRSGR